MFLGVQDEALRVVNGKYGRTKRTKLLIVLHGDAFVGKEEGPRYLILAKTSTSNHRGMLHRQLRL